MTIWWNGIVDIREWKNEHIIIYSYVYVYVLLMYEYVKARL